MKDFTRHIENQLKITINTLESGESDPQTRIRQIAYSIEAAIYQLESFISDNKMQ